MRARPTIVEIHDVPGTCKSRVSPPESPRSATKSSSSSSSIVIVAIDVDGSKYLRHAFAGRFVDDHFSHRLPHNELRDTDSKVGIRNEATSTLLDLLLEFGYFIVRRCSD
jgi:hypothetical protein